jgi:hypothetical protein
VEDIRALYAEFEAEEFRKKSIQTLAERIRLFVVNASDYIGNKRLLLDAMYELANKKIKTEKCRPIDKSYFKQIIKSTWNLEVDEKGYVWIRVDQVKR